MIARGDAFDPIGRTNAEPELDGATDLIEIEDASFGDLRGGLVGAKDRHADRVDASLTCNTLRERLNEILGRE